MKYDAGKVVVTTGRVEEEGRWSNTIALNVINRALGNLAAERTLANNHYRAAHNNVQVRREPRNHTGYDRAIRVDRRRLAVSSREPPEIQYGGVASSDRFYRADAAGSHLITRWLTARPGPSAPRP